MNGQPAVLRVNLANKQEQEHVIKIVMAFKIMTSQKHKVAIMATVQVNIDRPIKYRVTLNPIK